MMFFNIIMGMHFNRTSKCQGICIFSCIIIQIGLTHRPTRSERLEAIKLVMPFLKKKL